jgi:hypothetical protein
MHEHNLNSVGGRQVRSGRMLATRAGSAAAGIGVLLGGGAVYLLDRASTQALATTSRALLTTGVAGLVLMTVVIAARLLAHRHGRGGHPPGRRISLVRETEQLQPIPVRVTGATIHGRRRSA